MAKTAEEKEGRRRKRMRTTKHYRWTKLQDRKENVGDSCDAVRKERQTALQDLYGEGETVVQRRVIWLT